MKPEENTHLQSQEQPNFQQYIMNRFDVNIELSANSKKHKFKVTGENLDNTMFFKSLQDIEISLEKGYKLKSSQYLDGLIRSMRGRNGFNVRPLDSSESNPPLVIDGGDDLAVSLENAGLPKTLVHMVQTFGLYPAFMGIVHKGWLGANEEFNESIDGYEEAKASYKDLEDELLRTFKAKTEAQASLSQLYPYERLEAIKEQVQFQADIWDRLEKLPVKDIDQVATLRQVKSLIKDLKNHRASLTDIASKHNPEVLKQLEAFNPNDPEVQEMVSQIHELDDLKEAKLTGLIESTIGARFTDSGLGSMFWGMVAFESRAAIHLAQDFTQNSLSQGANNALHDVADIIGMTGDYFNMLGQGQMVASGLAKTGLGIHEVHSLNEWVDVLKDSPIDHNNADLAHVKKMLIAFKKDERNSVVKDVIGNMTLTLGQLGMILGGPQGMAVNALLFSGVGATIAGVGATQAVGQYSNRQFNILSLPSAELNEILHSTAKVGDQIEDVILDRVQKMYELGQDKAEVRVWQKIYKKAQANPKASLQKLVKLVEKSLSIDNEHYHNLYRKVLGEINVHDDALQEPLKLLQSKSYLDELRFDLHVCEHLSALNAHEDYSYKYNEHFKSGQAIVEILEHAETLGFYPDLERRIVKFLLNNKHNLQRNYGLDIHDFVSEVSAYKIPGAFSFPDPTRPIKSTIRAAESIVNHMFDKDYKIPLSLKNKRGKKRSNIQYLNKDALIKKIHQESDAAGIKHGAKNKPLTSIFLKATKRGNAFFTDERSAFWQAFNGQGKLHARSKVLDPVMVQTDDQIKNMEQLSPAIREQKAVKTRLHLDAKDLDIAFILSESQKLDHGYAPADDAFVRNQKTLSEISYISRPEHPDHKQIEQFKTSVKAVHSEEAQIKHVRTAKDLLNWVDKQVKKSTPQSYRVLFNDRSLAIVQEGQRFKIYDANQGTVEEIKGAQDFKAFLKQQSLPKKGIEVDSIAIGGDKASRIKDLTSIIYTAEMLLHTVDSKHGTIQLGNSAFTRVELLNLGLSKDGKLLTTDQLETLKGTLAPQDYSFHADVMHQYENKIGHDAADLKFKKLPHHSGLNLHGSQMNQKHIRDRAQLAQKEIKTFTKLHDQHAYQQKKHQKVAAKLSRSNTFYTLMQYPGSIFQAHKAVKNHRIKDAALGITSATLDGADMVLDAVANHKKVQMFYSKAANTAAKAGAFLSFVGAGFQIEAAHSSFKGAQNAQGMARTDHLVNGSMAVAGTVVAIGTGVGSLVSAAAGPIGAAIGLSIAIAHSTYTAVRETKHLRDLGMSKGLQFYAGVSSFFGFGLPKKVEAHAKYLENVHAQAKILKHLKVDKMIISDIDVVKAKDAQTGKAQLEIRDKHDYYNLSQQQEKNFEDVLEDKSVNLSHGLHNARNGKKYIGLEGSQAMVHRHDKTYDDGANLFMLGGGNDHAIGEKDRKNIFMIDGWGQKHFTGGDLSDSFEVVSWYQSGVQYHDEKHIRNSHLNGGKGIDTLSFVSYQNQDKENQTGIKASLQAGWARTADTNPIRIENIENVLGSEQRDEIHGNDVTNYLYGHKGRDTLKGLGGDDILNGGADADDLYGGQGNDLYTINIEDMQNKVACDIIHNKVHKADKKTGVIAQIKEYDHISTDLKRISIRTEGNTIFFDVDRNWITYKRLEKKLLNILTLDQSDEDKITEVYDAFSILRDELKTAISRDDARKILSQLKEFSHIEKQELLATQEVQHRTEKSGDNLIDLKLHSARKHRIQTSLYARFAPSSKTETIAKAYVDIDKDNSVNLNVLDHMGNAYLINMQEKDADAKLSTMLVSKRLKEGAQVYLDQNKVTYTLDGKSYAYDLASKDVSSVIGTAFNDLIVGDAKDNELRGGLGNDILKGFAGDDTLYAEGGHDRLEGGKGSDTYIITGNGTADSDTSAKARSHVEILLEDTDKSDVVASDTVLFNQGLQNLQVHASETLSVDYGNMSIAFKNFDKGLQNQLYFAVQDEQHAEKGSMQMKLVKNQLSLSHLDLSHANDMFAKESQHTTTQDENKDQGYKVDLNKHFYQYQEMQQGFKKYAKPIRKNKDTLIVTMSSKDDTFVAGSYDVFVHGGQGHDTYKINEKAHNVAIHNFDQDKTMDLLDWSHAALEDIQIKQNNATLYMRLKSDQGKKHHQNVFMRGWFKNEAVPDTRYHHIQMKTKDGTYDLSKLVQDMATHHTDDSQDHALESWTHLSKNTQDGHLLA